MMLPPPPIPPPIISPIPSPPIPKIRHVTIVVIIPIVRVIAPSIPVITVPIPVIRQVTVAVIIPVIAEIPGIPIPVIKPPVGWSNVIGACNEQSQRIKFA